MEFPGTLLIEIRPPARKEDRQKLFARLHALRHSVAQALNLTMQDMHAEAIESLRATWEGRSKDDRKAAEAWTDKVRTVLGRNWNAILGRERADRAAAEPDAQTIFAPIAGSALAEETATNITSRFSGEHLRNLKALRDGLPGFGDNSSFYCGGRFCEISGSLKQSTVGTFATEEQAQEELDAKRDEYAAKGLSLWVARKGDRFVLHAEDSAKIKLPLWGTGSKLVELVILPAGGSHRAEWRKLVAHFHRRNEVVLLQKELEKIRWTQAEKDALAALKTKKREALDALRAAKRQATDKSARAEVGALKVAHDNIEQQIKALIAAAQKRVQSEKDPLEQRLYGVTKLGRVGITYNERRRKWFVAISYIEYRPDVTTKGQKAAVNFGVNVFMQALAEDGTPWAQSGDYILAKRMQYAAARKSIQKSKRLFGRGSLGRGKKRRELPLTKRQGDETNFMTTYIRDLAARLIKWCNENDVADLYLEDLAGLREAFEKATEEQAHAEVKRRIHSWPYNRTGQEITRQSFQGRVRVHMRRAAYNSQRCPDCGHTAPENVQEVTVPGLPIVFEQVGRHRWVSGPLAKQNGVLYRRNEKTWRFECTACGKRGQADIVACMNMLINEGCFGDPSQPTPLDKMQEAAKKAVSSDKRKKVKRSGR